MLKTFFDLIQYLSAHSKSLRSNFLRNKICGTMIEESVFGRIVNPISTRRGGDRLFPLQYYKPPPPGFLDLATALNYRSFSFLVMRISEKDLTKDAFVPRA